MWVHALMFAHIGAKRMLGILCIFLWSRVSLWTWGLHFPGWAGSQQGLIILSFSPFKARLIGLYRMPTFVLWVLWSEPWLSVSDPNCLTISPAPSSSLLWLVLYGVIGALLYCNAHVLPTMHPNISGYILFAVWQGLAEFCIWISIIPSNIWAN